MLLTTNLWEQCEPIMPFETKVMRHAGAVGPSWQSDRSTIADKMRTKARFIHLKVIPF